MELCKIELHEFWYNYIKNNMLMMQKYVILTKTISSFASKLMSLTKTLQNTSKKYWSGSWIQKTSPNIWKWKVWWKINWMVWLWRNMLACLKKCIHTWRVTVNKKNTKSTNICVVKPTQKFGYYRKCLRASQIYNIINYLEKNLMLLSKNKRMNNF